MATSDTITIKTVDPPGPVVHCMHGNGVSTFTGTSGWQFTKRPRRESMTEFMGYDPYTLTVPVIFGDGTDPTINIDPALETLRGIARNLVGPRVEPAVVQIVCPAVPLSWMRWIINDLKFNTEYRSDDGSRYYAQIDITFFEWQPTDLVATKTGSSLAQKLTSAAKAQSTTPTTRVSSTPIASTSGIILSSVTYTVMKGDTLLTIAAETLGNANRWHEIAAMNNIRDPKAIKVGQQLRLPAGAKLSTALSVHYPIIASEW